MAMNTKLENDIEVDFAMLESDVQTLTAEYERLRRLSDLDQDVAEAKENVQSTMVKLVDCEVKLGRAILKLPSKEGLTRLNDNHPRRFISTCMEILHDKLLRDGERDLLRQDEDSAKLYYEQAKRVTEIMLTVQKHWPWHDEQVVSESIKQINNGQARDVRDIIAEIQN